MPGGGLLLTHFHLDEVETARCPSRLSLVSKRTQSRLFELAYCNSSAHASFNRVGERTERTCRETMPPTSRLQSAFAFLLVGIAALGGRLHGRLVEHLAELCQASRHA